MNKKSNTSSGAVSGILLILGAVLIIVIIVVFVVLRINATKSAAPKPATTTSQSAPLVPPPVYDTTLGSIRFVFESAVNLGNVLRPQNATGYGQNLTTTEKFIEVTIGAQNKGKTDTQQGSWDVGNIVDSEGRNFVSINDRAYAYLPLSNTCGAVLKPEFQPVPCVKLYEVSKASTGLRVQVNGAGSSGKKLQELINLIVQ